MTSILEEIFEVKRVEVERLKIDVPVSELERRITSQDATLDFAKALTGDRVRVIAEIKKASPSKGVLRQNFDPVSLAKAYVENGAAAISVLTNVDHFQGSIDYLAAVHNVSNPRGVPVLRKEFIFDPYQIYEARAYGADAVLLIVAMLTPDCLRELLELTDYLSMQCLVEVHNEDELDIAVSSGSEVIGINNRDLRTFETDLKTTERLAPQISSDKVIVSESGISTPKHIERVKKAGANAVLIGESLVTADDVGAKLRGLV